MRALTKPITRAEAIRRLKLHVRRTDPRLRVLRWESFWDYVPRDRAIRLVLVAHLSRRRALVNQAYFDRDLIST